MNFELDGLLQNELRAGETVVWSAMPDPKRYTLKSIPTVLFGLPFTAFAIFWIAGACGFKMPNFSSPISLFPLFGLPFLLIGLGMLLSPIWMRRKASLTGYFITNQRAILIEKKVFQGFGIRSFVPAQLDSMERIQRQDGSGDIILAREIQTTNKGTRTVPIGFFGIPNVKEVDALLATLAAKP